MIRMWNIFLKIGYMKYAVNASQRGWYSQSVRNRSHFLQNLKRSNEPPAQFSFLPKSYASLEWGYFQKHMISNFKLQWPSPNVGVALLPTLGDL